MSLKTTFLMKTGILFLLLSLAGKSTVYAMAVNNGSNNPEAVTDFKDLTHKWYLVSDMLVPYDGLSRYCIDPSFQAEVMEVHTEIHRYDSTLYVAIYDIAAESKDRKLKRALKKIGHFENKYNALALSMTLKSECYNQKKLERQYRKAKNYFGAHSFDNQVVITEAFLKKNIDQIHKLMESIEDHVHHLTSDQVQ